MLAKRIPRAIIVCLAVLALHLALTATVFAQAWVPPKAKALSHSLTKKSTFATILMLMAT